MSWRGSCQAGPGVPHFNWWVIGEKKAHYEEILVPSRLWMLARVASSWSKYKAPAEWIRCRYSFSFSDDSENEACILCGSAGRGWYQFCQDCQTFPGRWGCAGSEEEIKERTKDSTLTPRKSSQLLVVLFIIPYFRCDIRVQCEIQSPYLWNQATFSLAGEIARDMA